MKKAPGHGLAFMGRQLITHTPTSRTKRLKILAQMEDGKHYADGLLWRAKSRIGEQFKIENYAQKP